MPANTTEIEKRLWDAADKLRANSKLKSSEYSIPALCGRVTCSCRGWPHVKLPSTNGWNGDYVCE